MGMFLNQVGLSGLMNPDVGILLAMNSVVSAATWQMSGYTMAIYLAGCAASPKSGAKRRVWTARWVLLALRLSL